MQLWQGKKIHIKVDEEETLGKTEITASVSAEQGCY